MAVEYFDENVNDETVASGGFDVVLPGFYQLRVAQVNETESNIEVDLEVVSGTKNSEVNKVHREFFATNSKNMNRKRRVALALASNLVTPDQMKRARETNQCVQIDYRSAVGQHIVAEIEHQERQQLNNQTGEWVGTGKTAAKIPYDNIWHIDSKEVRRKNVPIDKSKIDVDPFGNPPEESKTTEGDF
jgi:hypothetical protein